MLRQTGSNQANQVGCLGVGPRPEASAVVHARSARPGVWAGRTAHDILNEAGLRKDDVPLPGDRPKHNPLVECCLNRSTFHFPLGALVLAAAVAGAAQGATDRGFRGLT